jgi:transcriptional regulator with XRE-family HTH domain
MVIMYARGNIMDWYGMSDKAIIRDIGKRLKQIRLNKNITQQKLSKKSGVHRTTISKIETGQQISLLTLIQVLRGLGELQRLENIIPEEIVSPMQLARLQGKKRKRAS